MKQILCKSLKTLSLLMLLVLFLIPQNHEAQNRKKKKNDTNSENVQKSAAKDKEKTINELVKSSREIDGLFKIYQDTIKGTIQMLVSKDQIGKEYIHDRNFGKAKEDWVKAKEAAEKAAIEKAIADKAAAEKLAAEKALNQKLESEKNDKKV